MAGVREGTKRGPYAKRILIDDFKNLRLGEKSFALLKFLGVHSEEEIKIIRKAVKGRSLTSEEMELLENWLTSV